MMPDWVTAVDLSGDEDVIPPTTPTFHLHLIHLPSFGSCSCVVLLWSISLCSVKEESDSNRITLGFVPLNSHLSWFRSQGIWEEILIMIGILPKSWKNNLMALTHNYVFFFSPLPSLRHLKVTPWFVSPFCSGDETSALVWLLSNGH